MTSPTTCRTQLLSDLPAETDRFGSHQRVADAIAEIIASEDGGKVIGIQGDWGSGKSTIIQLLRSRMASNPKVCMLIFDAWAHQGDPLRRTFLDRLVEATVSPGWVQGKAWRERLKELHGRKQVTVSKETPHLTTFGKALGLFAVLLPIGAAMLGGGIEAGKWLPGIVGAVLAFLLPGALVLNLAIRRGAEEAWTIFTGRTVSEVVTESAKTPDPTSVEFEEAFVQLMDTALRDTSRRLVLVLDNLDRVDERDALAVWATLQTFLQAKEHMKPSWLPHLWLVIPFARDGVRRLWPGIAEGEGTEDLPASFIDKTMQACFDAPPPVLSDWRSFLVDLLAQALPDHAETDFHGVYQVFYQYRGHESPTPRELKAYVNSIGAYHRQWRDELPLVHLAYMALLRRDGRPIIDELVKGSIPDQRMTALLGPSVVDDLAALTFNVERGRARELLLSGPIAEAVLSGDGKAFSELASNHPRGFWPVVEGMHARGDLPWGDVASIANAASCFADSELFNAGGPPEARRLARGLKDGAKRLSYWGGFTTETAKGLLKLFSLAPDDDGDLARSLIAGMSAWQVGNSAEAGDPSQWAAALFCLLEGLEGELIVPETVAKDGIPINIDGAGWLGLCSAMGSEPQRRYIRLLRPTLSDEEMMEAFSSKISSGNFVEVSIDAISVAREYRPDVSWEPVVNACGERLRAGVAVAPEEIRHLLGILWRIAGWDPTATSKLRELTNQGHLFHQLYVASTVNDDPTFAWCLMSILWVAPSGAPQSHVGNSNDGQSVLASYVAAPTSRPGVLDAIDAVPIFLRSAEQLFKVLDALPSAAPFVARRLGHQLEGGVSDRSLTPELVHRRWQFIRDQLGEAALWGVLEGMLKEGALQSYLRGLGFSTDDAPFYVQIAHSGGLKKSAVRSFISNGLRAIDGANWASHLAGESPVAELAALCGALSKPIRLGLPFRDALIDHSRRVARGEINVNRLVSVWPQLSRLVEPTNEGIFNRRVIEALADADGRAPSQFFELYGAIIANPKAMHESKGAFNVLTPMVRERNLPGIRWALTFLEDNESFLGEHPDKDAVEEFREVVRERLAEAVGGANEELQTLLEQLSSVVGKPTGSG